MESKTNGVRRSAASTSTSSASISAPRSALTATKPPRSGQLVLLLTVPAVAPAPDDGEYEYEEDEFDMNDGMSESAPSHVLVNSSSNDEQEDGMRIEVEHSGSPKSKRRCTRKKGIPVSPKGRKQVRGNHFKLVKAVSKKEPGKTVEKAKCIYCGKTFAYTQGGQTSSLNRHIKKCPKQSS